MSEHQRPMLRMAAAILSWLTCVVSGLVSAPSYGWLLAISLASFSLYFELVAPFIRRAPVLVLLLSAPLLLLSVDTVRRALASL